MGSCYERGRLKTRSRPGSRKRRKKKKEK